MAKKMSDDEIMNYAMNKMFGDLDHIESENMFKDGPESRVEGMAENAKPESSQSGGVKITVEPLMAGAQESGKPTMDAIKPDEEEDDDEYDSPIMARLRGK